jgi:hypothetical protein
MDGEPVPMRISQNHPVAIGLRLSVRGPSIVIMVVLVALLLAYHLTAAHRATRQPNESRPPAA